MAPIKPKGSTARVRTSDSLAPVLALNSRPSSTSVIARTREKASQPTADDAQNGFDFDDSFKLSKKDKRTLKHGQLMHKVRESGIDKEKKLKRRRPQKKLKADITDLANALPDQKEDGEEWEDENEDSAAGEKTGKMKMKSLRHRPGAMKRKKAMEGKEMERFGKNLAQMNGSSAERWKALRAFIGETLEKDKAFG